MNNTLQRKKAILKDLLDHLTEVQLTKIFDVIKSTPGNQGFDPSDESGSYLVVEKSYQRNNPPRTQPTAIRLRGSDAPDLDHSASQLIDTQLADRGDDEAPKASPFEIFGSVAQGGSWVDDDPHHCVEAGDTVDGDPVATVFFETRQQAQIFADAVDAGNRADGPKSTRRFSYVWLSEWGAWRKPRAKSPKEDWVYYWWSDSVARTWGQRPTLGNGIPEATVRELMSPDNHIGYDPL